MKYTFFGMDFEVFALERLQSIWEHKVGWNLAESGVHPLRVEELVDREGDRQALLSLPLGYPQTNGTLELRASIASMYPGATPAHVQVTNGGSEANLVTLMHLVQPSDEVVVMMPNYMQVRGLGRALQAEVRHWTLSEGARKDQPRWAPDLDALRTLVTERTRAILICNPNNPTGARLTASELDEICTDCRSFRRMGRVGRDLPRRRARRRRDADCMGSLRARDRHVAACRRPSRCPACGSAGSSRRRH